MKKKIKRSFIGFTSVIVIVIAVVLSMVFYNITLNQTKKDLYEIAELSAVILQEDVENFSILEEYVDYTRLSVITKDGRVIYDNIANIDTLDDHSDRDEIAEAFYDGDGEITRFSTTMGSESYYVAIAIDDQMALRASRTTSSILGVFLQTVPFIIIIFLILLIFSNFFAKKLAEKILLPIKSYNPKDFDDQMYEELSAFTSTIASQQDKITLQTKDLKELDHRLQLVLSQMNEGFILLDDKDNIVLINQSAKKTFNSRQDIAGRNIMELTRNPDILKSLKEIQNNQSAKLKYQQKDKIYQLLFTQSQSGWKVVLVLDITQSEQTARIRSDFSSNVSHELKTPLANISGYAEAIVSGMVKPEDTIGFVKKIQSEAQRMIGLIGDIIMLSEIEEKQTTMHKEDIVLENIVKEVFADLADTAQTYEINLSSQGEGVILAHYHLIYELILNLVDNAIRYNKPQGFVNVEISQAGGLTTIKVSDSGIGIPIDEEDRIFERFYRVEKSRSKKTGGTGLGLSIVKHIVSFYDGNISLQDNQPTGTIVTVVLPTGITRK